MKHKYNCTHNVFCTPCAMSIPNCALDSPCLFTQRGGVQEILRKPKSLKNIGCESNHSILKLLFCMVQMIAFDV